MKRRFVLGITIFLVMVGISFALWGDRLGHYVMRSGASVPDATGLAPASTTQTTQPTSTEMVRITSPLPDAAVISPLVVTGEARGSWYFEASFPVTVVDANGRVLGSAPAHAQSEWMTTQFVPFVARVSFSPPTTATGTLILKKDNPSGQPEYDADVRIPVRFHAQTRPVLLYYYDPRKDTDASGNVLCSRQGLVAVSRQIPMTTTPIQDAVRELLRGDITVTERSQGITTEFPLPDLRVKGADMKNETLTLELDDPQNTTSGGSCRASILWFQIEATAKQFAGVERVVFTPDHLFQP